MKVFKVSNKASEKAETRGSALKDFALMSSNV